MSDLTISEVKAKIREAEKEILTILENLQKTTGVAVEEVRVDTTSFGYGDGMSSTLIARVDIATGSL